MLQILLLSWLALSQMLDCENFSTFDDCHGKTHEGDWCYWKAESFECISGEPNDPDHVCGEIGDAQSCQADSRCGWEESKCQDINDIENPVIIPSTGGNTAGTTAPTGNTVTSEPATSGTQAGTQASGTTAASSGTTAASSGTTAASSGTTAASSGTTAASSGTTAASGTETTATPTNAGTQSGTQSTGTSAPGPSTNSGCGQFTDSGSCDSYLQCAWMETTNTCEATYIQPGEEADCEMYMSPDACNGKMHEGKACYWDPEGQECDEASPNDPEHLCPTLSQADCQNAQGLCGWNELENLCLSQADSEPDCEGWVDPDRCNGKKHEGKTCYFDVQEQKCIESDPGDPDHLCQTFLTLETCTGGLCFWSSAFGCQSADEYEAPEGYPSYPYGGNTGGNTGNTGGNTNTGGIATNGELDCEMYLTTADCGGQTHEGKVCYWHAESGECEEGGIGDLEHICGQYGDSTSCQQETGCMWDLEGKCTEFSTFLTSVNCVQLSVDTCDEAHQCLFSSSGCVNRYLSSPSSSPSPAPVSGLWLAGFVLGNVLLGAACALVCRNCFLQRKPSQSYVNLDILEEQMVV